MKNKMTTKRISHSTLSAVRIARMSDKMVGVNKKFLVVSVDDSNHDIEDVHHECSCEKEALRTQELLTELNGIIGNDRVFFVRDVTNGYKQLQF